MAPADPLPCFNKRSLATALFTQQTLKQIINQKSFGLKLFTLIACRKARNSCFWLGLLLCASLVRALRLVFTHVPRCGGFVEHLELRVVGTRMFHQAVHQTDGLVHGSSTGHHLVLRVGSMAGSLVTDGSQVQVFEQRMSGQWRSWRRGRMGELVRFVLFSVAGEREGFVWNPI